MILETVRQAIINDATCAALVGTRVYAIVYPSNPTWPVITLRVVAQFDENTNDDVKTSRIQIDVWSDDIDESAAVASAVKTLFRRMGETVNSQRIIFSKVDLAFDQFEQNLKLYRHVVDVRITHEGD